MSNHDETTVWERVRRPRASRLPSGVDHDRRTVKTSLNLLAYLPLALACLAGVSGYVRLEAKVGELERNARATEARIIKELDKADQTHAAMWRRMTE